MTPSPAQTAPADSSAGWSDRLAAARLNADQIAGLAVAVCHGGIVVWVALLHLSYACDMRVRTEYELLADLPFSLIVAGMHLIFVALGERIATLGATRTLRRVFVPVGLAVSGLIVVDILLVIFGVIDPQVDYYDANPTARLYVFAGILIPMTIGVATLAITLLRWRAMRRAH